MFVKENMTKPVIGYVAGLTAPKGRRMGHAGAIISAFGDTAAEKAEIMRSLGLTVAPSPAELGTTVAEALAEAARKRTMVTAMSAQPVGGRHPQAPGRRSRRSCSASSTRGSTRTTRRSTPTQLQEALRDAPTRCCRR